MAKLKETKENIVKKTEALGVSRDSADVARCTSRRR
jgi:hypothetical protein